MSKSLSEKVKEAIAAGELHLRRVAEAEERSKAIAIKATRKWATKHFPKLIEDAALAGRHWFSIDWDHAKAYGVTVEAVEAVCKEVGLEFRLTGNIHWHAPSAKSRYENIRSVVEELEAYINDGLVRLQWALEDEPADSEMHKHRAVQAVEELRRRLDQFSAAVDTAWRKSWDD